MRIGTDAMVAVVVLVAARPVHGQGVAVEGVGPGVVSTNRNERFPAEDPVTGALRFSAYEGSFADQTTMVAEPTSTGWAEPRVAGFSGRWGVRREGSGWGEPELLPAPFNSEAEDIHAAVTREALWLASNRAGGHRRSDIYRVTWDGGVEHLGAPINSELSQPDLWVSQDGDVMVLAITDHPEGYGGDDLWVSRHEGGAWSSPRNLGPEVNSSDYEYGPTLSRDGRFLYFTSHGSGSADIWRMPLSAVLRGPG